MKRLRFVVALLVVLVVLGACSSEPELQTVEITRIISEIEEMEVTRMVEIEVEKEVTRIVEVPVEVTRIIEEMVIVTPTVPPPAAPPASCRSLHQLA